MRPPFLLLISLIFFSISVQPAHAPLRYSLQVGARGDANSVNNMGLRAEIRTHIYHVNSPDADSFWVGDNLVDGAFIQFGYSIEPPGNYCSNAEMGAGIPFTCPGGYQTVNGSEPLWVWTYFPVSTSNHFYYGVGRSGLAEVNGTWHLYSLMADAHGGWSFLIDGHQVATASFPSRNSSDQASFVAEKTGSTTPGPLGPVEFRNLGYLQQDGWHQVTALYAIVNCGANASCIQIPYGVSLVGPNHIIAGTSITQPKDGQLLWNSAAQSATTGAFVSTMPELFYGALAAGVVVVLIIIEFVVLPRRRRTSPQRSPAVSDTLV
jgi:hypothetical protein